MDVVKPSGASHLTFLLPVLLLLSACSLPSDEMLLDGFYEHQPHYEELNDIIKDAYLSKENVRFDSFTQYLQMLPRYTDFIHQVGILRTSVRSDLATSKTSPAVFFELAESDQIFRYNFGASKGIVSYPGGPPTSYRHRIVLNIDKAPYLNVSETTETFRHIEGDWYLYEKVEQ